MLLEPAHRVLRYEAMQLHRLGDDPALLSVGCVALIMSYVLEALIVDERVTVDDALRIVPLGSRLRMVPMTAMNKTLIAERFPGSGTMVPDFDHLDDSKVQYAEHLSTAGRVAYVHVEFSAGLGFQAALGWADGNVALGPFLTANHESERIYPSYAVRALPDLAVNVALRFLGVVSDAGLDEFDTVGLGRHRATDDWL